jgi:cell division protease FtsH
VNNLRNLLLWIIIAVLLVFLFNMFQGTANRPASTTTNYTEFNQEVGQGAVKKVTIQGEQIKYELSNGQTFTTYAPNDPELTKRLLAHNVPIIVQPADDGMPTLVGVIINWFPMLLLIGVWVFFLRQMQAGGGKAMGFG